MEYLDKKSKRKKGKEIAKNDDEILLECVNYVNDWYKYYNEHIQRARNFLTFLYVDQWELTDRQAREALSKPCMQFNKLTPIIRAILGDWRDNSPQLTVRGVGKDVTQADVDIREGLIRQIQYESDADIAYQIAGKQLLECGWGAARVIADYESPDSFKQCLKIMPIMDYQAAFWDPTAQEVDKSDGDYCGVYTVMSKDTFCKLYPDIENPQPIVGYGNNYYLQWNTRATILICEIYYKEYYKKTLVQLSDGKEFDLDEANEILEMQEQFLASNPDAQFMGFQPLTIENKREVRDYTIKHKKFIQNHILEKTDYPGKILPIVYIEGDSTIIDGLQIPLPYIQDAIDTQKLINYLGSEMAYAFLRARKDTVMGTPENFAGHEEQWLNPDQVQGALTYNWDKNAGKPEFITPPSINPAFMQGYENASQDLMQILGRFEEARGQESNAISGIAINARQRAANKPVNVYNDNLQRGIKQIGKIILEMIPHIYDTEREVMIRTADNQSKAVDINQQKGFNMLPNGDVEPNIANDMKKGKYDIEVRVDGSYDAQQVEAMNTLIKLAQVNPAIGNLIPDLLAENSGLENTQQLVERLRTLVPPDIIAKEEGKPLPPQQPAPPDPAILIQQEKNQIAKEQNALKARQQMLDQEKITMEANLSGLDAKVNMTKAQAEIHKANIDKDIAILSHVNSLHERRV